MTGIVLVAINPYEDLAIYDTDTIMAYRGQDMANLDPHIFAVSEAAFTQMERENVDQSIIVSGESGAGKTVSAKYAMRFFATVSGSSDETQIEQKVLASNPIMEVCPSGNLLTSRRGKYEVSKRMSAELRPRATTLDRGRGVVSRPAPYPFIAQAHPSCYAEGARVWVPDKDAVWKSATISKDYKGTKGEILHLILDDDQEEFSLEIKNEKDLPPLRNPDILVGENDLTALSYLHEPAVLHNLQYRFNQHNAIYTYCGIVLVAINPYEDLAIYDTDTIMAYRGQDMANLDPHIFAVSEAAFTQMERENVDQSIIVSGESGAGKTVSAKYAMRFFATVSGSSDETQIEQKVLASNPIMEAIGNAKTTRNDNSSRFGKYIELDFTKQYTIFGANMRTYLLEKSRVVFQAANERNYHIFYQLCSAGNLPEMEPLKLAHQDQFHYLNQGGNSFIESIDDLEQFQATRNALSILGISNDMQMQVFRILAAILHLGNIAILDTRDQSDSCHVPKNDPHLLVVSDLLQVDKEGLAKWLTNRRIVSQREVFTKPMTSSEAMFARDALAKHVYANQFGLIVECINKSLASASPPFRFIGVLDIYGFETFEVNSFEQFCINYANEKLQQQFCQHVFKLEQEEYLREQIEWKFIDYYDNQPCINLIEGRPLGILSLLDDECRMPKGSDESWVLKLYDKCKGQHHFSKPRLSNTAFIISHFADQVAYECAGFLEKNRDTVHEEQISVLKASHDLYVVELFLDEEERAKHSKARPSPMPRGSSTPTSKTAPSAMPRGSSTNKGLSTASPSTGASPSASKHRKQTVGSQFHDSLNLLMKTLNATTPHYVRCIKPNDDKMAFNFDPKRAVQQLRACGVLETVRISAAGFPSRWTYPEFFWRYRVLIKTKDIKRSDLPATCAKIIQGIIQDEDKYKFGKTKLFLRAGQLAYMEKRRSDRLLACGVLIQRIFRGFLARRNYRQITQSILLLQTFGRGFLARRTAQEIRQTRAAIKIQKHVRSFVCQRKYQRMRAWVIRLQAHIRAHNARLHYLNLLHNAKAVVIQRHIRGFLARREYSKAKRNLIIVQNLWRRKCAIHELKELRKEARSVEHVKKLNRGLENKIMSLQNRIDELVSLAPLIPCSLVPYFDLDNATADAKENSQFHNLQTENHRLQAKIKELQAHEHDAREAQLVQIRQLQEELKEERLSKEQMAHELKEKQKSLEARQAERDEAQLKSKELQDQLARMEEDFQGRLKDEIEKAAERRVKEATHEMDSLLARNQALIMEKEQLQQTVEELRVRQHFPLGPQYWSASSNISVTSEAPTDIVRDDASDLAHMDHLSVTSSELPLEEDAGYGSTRVRDASDQRRLENLGWHKPEDGADPERTTQHHVQLLLEKLRKYEHENAELRGKLHSQQTEKSVSPLESAADHIRLQELEIETSKQKEELKRLRMAAAAGHGALTDEIMAQHQALEDELMRRRDECIELRSVLADQANRVTDGLGEGENQDYAAAYDALKKTLRQLSVDLQREKEQKEELQEEMKRLRKDNERQQTLLAENLRDPQGHTERMLQSDVLRLTNENLVGVWVRSVGGWVRSVGGWVRS
ncbi:unnamed protein product, partial [Darwinula stevensoni]